MKFYEDLLHIKLISHSILNNPGVWGMKMILQ